MKSIAPMSDTKVENVSNAIYQPMHLTKDLKGSLKHELTALASGVDLLNLKN